MKPLIVLYDACVLYPAPLRSFLMYLAMSNLYQARWSNDIHEEWIRNVQQDYPGFTREQGEKIRDLMNAHVEDCLVTGYEALIPSLTLPDPDDRHILAAAIIAQADVIVTFNLRDFPPRFLAPHKLIAQHPDDFLLQQWDQSPEQVCLAARRQRQSLLKPPLSAAEYLATLARQGLPKIVKKLTPVADHI